MAHFHEGSSYLTHSCKNCGQSTGHGLHHDIEPHLCSACLQAEKRNEMINKLLGNEKKKWYKFWK